MAIFNTLRGKLTASFLLMALIPLGIISGASYYRAKASLESTTETMLDNSSEGVIGKVDLMIASRVREVAMLAQAPGVAASLESGRSGEGARLPLPRAFLAGGDLPGVRRQDSRIAGLRV
ncbi:hypothetical protein L4X63_05830 [Geomonas sp. Red32]|uniref:hypothetical protein n=1 Tax=Geomonas sp. Red32 TaxID=2912856 RepID=UPI00202D081D|nr:hypothetical protein [Geomonas sp. Red32]MCM0081104.1 hypothetical protein [Geomonas sp. Red32]